MASPLVDIVKHCGVGRGGALKSYRNNSAPSLSLRLLSIGDFGEEGGIVDLGTPIPTKDNGDPSSVD